jgi:crotonobetainyl-CoA:carnitine CoA-transferase CaiB-like acyl-CoA transferase
MRVVSFCHFLQGPAAMQYLADMGAEIIKIEPPRGAYERHWAGAGGAMVGGVSSFYLCANRGARSIAIDLKRPGAVETVMRLIDRSHVVAENFRPGALDRLGLGYEQVKARKPDIIYASASGFGSTGPLARKPGQDLVIQAMSGLVAANGGGDRPVAIGAAAADQHGAALLAMGISAAYAKWLATGEGTRVESTLLGAGIDLHMESLVTYYASGASGPDVLRRDPHLATWFHQAPYGVYRLKDADVAISLNPFDKLASVLASERIAAFVGRDPYECRNEFAPVLAEELAGRTYAELSAAFDAHDMWYARVDDFDALAENPQVRHNGVFREIEVNGERTRIVTHPLRYDGKDPGEPRFSLEQGSDTLAVLSESGFSDEEVERLLADGAVHAPGRAGAMAGE